MSNIWGMVMKRTGERAEVKIDKTRSAVEGLPKYLDCWNPISARAGEVVGIEFQELTKSKANLITFGFPVLGILAGVACGHSLANFFHGNQWVYIGVAVVIWLGVTINYARIFRRDAVREGAQPTIVEIEMKAPAVSESNSVKPNEEVGGEAEENQEAGA